MGRRIAFRVARRVNEGEPAAGVGRASLSLGVRVGGGVAARERMCKRREDDVEDASEVKPRAVAIDGVVESRSLSWLQSSQARRVESDSPLAMALDAIVRTRQLCSAAEWVAR